MRKFLAWLVLSVVAMFAATACSKITTPAISLDTIPIYPGSEHIIPSLHPTAAAADRMVKQANANGHKNEMRAYLLPPKTTAAQIREFYVPKLKELGGEVRVVMDDNAPLGWITLDYGMQALTIDYDNMDSHYLPLLMIDSFIPNGNR
jgi:hypothetical protein